MKEQLEKTGIKIIGIITGVNATPKGRYIVDLMVKGMDSIVKLGLEPGVVPDPKKYELGSVLATNMTISHWNGNVYFNDVN